MAKRNNKVVKQEEGGVTEAPYEPCIVVTDTPHCISAKPSVEDEVAKYNCGASIPDLLKAILTELVRARLERG